MNLTNKIIVVTGGSKGIGRALTERLAVEKTRLILIARSEGRLKEFISKYGKDHNYYVCDLSSIEETTNLINKIERDYDKVDVLLNIAGIGVYKDFEFVSQEDWHRSFAVNVTAPFLLTKGLLPLLIKRKRGSLVMNIGSGAGTIPTRGRSTYCASKFALRGWTLSLAEEFEGKTPKFCLITLGSTMTNFSGMTIGQKKEARAAGKAYFPTEWLANKLVEIIKDDDRNTEIDLFPWDYGFGTW